MPAKQDHSNMQYLTAHKKQISDLMMYNAENCHYELIEKECMY